MVLRVFQMTRGEEMVPRESPLSQPITKEGKTVSVEIYEDGNGKWILEVVDEANNSTVWDDPFDSDALALKEALRTIKEEGISSLIGAPRDPLYRTKARWSPHKLNDSQLSSTAFP